MGVRPVVDFHELANGSVGVLLGGGEGLVAEEFLNGAKIGAIGEKMRRESMTQRVRVQVPVDVNEANVFFDDAPDRTLREAPPRIIEKDRFCFRGLLAARSVRLLEKLLAKRPVFLKRFLGLGTVRNNAFLVAFAAYPENAFSLLDVSKIKAGKFADAQARSIKKFEEGAVPPEEQIFFRADGWIWTVSRPAR